MTDDANSISITCRPRQQQSIFTTSAGASDRTPGCSNPNTNPNSAAAAGAADTNNNPDVNGGEYSVLTSLIHVEPSGASTGEGVGIDVSDLDLDLEGANGSSEIHERERALQHLDSKDCCESVFAWILVLVHVVLISFLFYVNVHLLFYAPHTHGWYAVTKLYGIDTHKSTDNEQCRHQLSNGDDNDPQPQPQVGGQGQVHDHHHREMCPSSSTSANAKNAVQCPNEIYFGTKASQRFIFYILFILTISSFVWYLLTKNKMKEASILIELCLAVSFLTSLCVFIWLALRVEIELELLKGNMALDWSPDLISELWDETQRNGKCCGIDDFSHWRIPITTGNDNGNGNSGYSYPLTCCDPKKSNCNKTATISSCHVWTRGCYEGEYYMVVKYGLLILAVTFMQLFFSSYGLGFMVSTGTRNEIRRVLPLSFEDVPAPRASSTRRRNPSAPAAGTGTVSSQCHTVADHDVGDTRQHPSETGTGASANRLAGQRHDEGDADAESGGGNAANTEPELKRGKPSPSPVLPPNPQVHVVGRPDRN